MQPATRSAEVDGAEMIAPSGAGTAADAAFWATSSYRSGGADWREFLSIDADHDDAEFTASFAAVRNAESARPEVEAMEPAPEADAFGSWITAPDDLLPSR